MEQYQEINIATARISIQNMIFCEQTNKYFAWTICNFTYYSHHSYKTQIIKQVVGNNAEKCKFYCDKFKETFEQVHIHSGDKVAVMFNENGHIIAIGAIGKDSWIDMRSGLSKKSFKELNIIPASLSVF